MNNSKTLIHLFILILLLIFFISCKKEEKRIMKVRNDSISQISYTTAKAYATIIDPGDGIVQHGHCWSTNSESITIDIENKTENGPVNTSGSYSSNLTNLSPGQRYYVRAYVRNGGTVIYGTDVIPFITLSMSPPVVITGTASEITSSSATVSGILDSLGAGASLVTQHGHCWSSETTTPVIEDNENKTSLGSKATTCNYESELIGLSAGTLYYVRAYATNDAGTSYGEALSFSTYQSSSTPSVVTASVSSITATSAICGGSITSDGGSPIIAKGVCWNSELNPTISDNHTNDGTGSSSFASEITGLVENTTYYVRAYATNSVGTAYGNHVSFTASDETSIPTVTTTATVSDITTYSAVSGGNVTSDGGADVTSRGVCWNITGNPVKTDDHTTDGSGTGAFTSNITGLSEGTLYYVKAYATNNEGTAYGDQVSFSTLEDVGLPVVTTITITDVTSNTAASGGNVTSDGGSSVTARGVCWNTTGSPTISDDNTSDGSGTGVFNSSITGLSAGTLYYVRAYATNSTGIGYGNELYFTTELISWQKSLGGSLNEEAYSVQQTTDGGYIIAGRSESNNGDVSGNNGNYDYWIVKLTSAGVLSWQKSFGGSGYDQANDIQQTTDGGYIVAGHTYSNNGDVSENNGQRDYWIVKLTSSGNIDWEKSFGGSNKERTESIQQTNDGGYIIAGYTESDDGDVTVNHGSSDYWIVKLTSTGNLDWEISLGGSNVDMAQSVQQTSDGGYIVAGESYSNDGDVTANNGEYDCWIVKLTSAGDLDWQKSFGGSGSDGAYCIQQTADYGYIIAGYSTSSDGEVSENNGGYDYWIVKLNSSGNITWEKSLGGSSDEYAY